MGLTFSLAELFSVSHVSKRTQSVNQSQLKPITEIHFKIQHDHIDQPQPVFNLPLKDMNEIFFYVFLLGQT